MTEKVSTISALGRAEVRGIPVDKEYISDLCATYESRINELKIKIESAPEVLTIPNFNIDSNHDLQTLFFDKLNFKPVRKTKTGYSTDKDVIDELLRTINTPSWNS
jgi:DNA polymerase-1